jgi:histone-lysine N-methyltransferase SUV39H
MLTAPLGLRSPTAIQAGQFIDCYLGEVITNEVADDREDARISKDEASYLFSLDFFSGDDLPVEDLYVVDGRKYGSVTRFMNHSCKPNCKLFSVSHNHSDSKLFEAAFFALTDIPPFTELTFDYCPSWKPTDAIDPDAVKCLCGAENCRGQLWPNQRKTMHYDDSDSE